MKSCRHQAAHLQLLRMLSSPCPAILGKSTLRTCSKKLIHFQTLLTDMFNTIEQICLAALQTAQIQQLFKECLLPSGF